MRTFPSLLLASAMLMTFSACAQPSQDTSPAATSTENAVAAYVPTAGVVNEINQNDFAQVVAEWNGTREWKFKGSRPAVIDFNATWCGPCRQLAPILKELAADYAGQVDFYSVDVDDNRGLASAFGVRSIPMLLICPVDGQPQAIVGLHPKTDIQQAITEVTGGQVSE